MGNQIPKNWNRGWTDQHSFAPRFEQNPRSRARIVYYSKRTLFNRVRSLLIYSGRQERAYALVRLIRNVPKDAQRAKKLTFVLERVRINARETRSFLSRITVQPRAFQRSRKLASQFAGSRDGRGPRAARYTRPQWNLGARRVLPLRN